MARQEILPSLADLIAAEPQHRPAHQHAEVARRVEDCQRRLKNAHQRRLLRAHQRVVTARTPGCLGQQRQGLLICSKPRGQQRKFVLRPGPAEGGVQKVTRVASASWPRVGAAGFPTVLPLSEVRAKIDKVIALLRQRRDAEHLKVLSRYLLAMPPGPTAFQKSTAELFSGVTPSLNRRFNAAT